MKAARMGWLGMAILAGALAAGSARQALAADASAPAALGEALSAEFDLAAPRTEEPQHYLLTTTMIPYSTEGTRDPKIVYRLKLEGGTQDGQETYTCVETTMKAGDAQEVSIPSLAGWSYTYSPDEGGTTLGIPHEPFQGLIDSNGKAVDPLLTHPIYNQFIDFHAFCNVFPRPSSGGRDVRMLKRVGDTVVHDAAYSEGSIELAGVAAEGSYFQNGEITITFKGLAVVDGASCAVVFYDSGESSLHMNLEPTPGVQVNVVGTSHYFGDIWIDLDSMWVRRAEMEEFVVSNVTMGGEKVGGQTVERTVLIEKVTPEEFEQA